VLPIFNTTYWLTGKHPQFDEWTVVWPKGNQHENNVSLMNDGYVGDYSHSLSTDACLFVKLT
jgi:hypothetical protein